MKSYFDKEKTIDGPDVYAQATSLIDIEKNLQKGVQLHRQGKLEEAQKIYNQILSIDPFHAQAWHLSGVVALQCDEPALSRERVATAISLNPHDASMYYNQAMALERLQLNDEAIASYDKAIAIQPDDVKAYINRGAILKAIGKLDEAISSYNSAIGINPDSVEAYSNRGNALAEARRWMEALESYDLAISLNPDIVQTHINRANALLSLQRLDDAIISYEHALSTKPKYVSEHAEAYSSRGVALKTLKRINESIKSFDKAIEIKPNYAAAYLNKSFALLLDGEYREGWRLHEWRWQQENLKLEADSFAEPLWLGIEDINSKTILLHAEQGLGDAIQFCRYAKLVKDLGATVFLEVPKQLLGLLQNLDYVDILLERGKPRPAFDIHCPLMSLPMVFGTELTSIPMPFSYIYADEAKKSYWKEKLSGRSRLKVGVVWNGGFRPDQPELWATNERRNIPLNVFAKGLNFVDADFFSLQKGDPAEAEIRDQEQRYWPGSNFYNYASELRDFTDTAALIANLDMVLSVDTSTAHLAAAMGKPTWILNRYDTCWRWLLDRDDSPWYDAVTIYRQSADMLWEPVLNQVVNNLMGLCNERK